MNNEDKKIIWIGISLVKPYPKNVKKHPVKQIRRIANSIKEFGFNQPIVVDKNNVIIVGHGRLKAAKVLRMEKVPVLIADLNEQQARAYRLADNKLNESGWNKDFLIEEIRVIEDKKYLDIIGYDIKDLFKDREEEKIGIMDFKTELLEENNYLVFVFDDKMDWMALTDYFKLRSIEAKDSKAGYRRKGVGRILDGNKLLDLIKGK